jgi:hypothetical protein
MSTKQLNIDQFILIFKDNKFFTNSRYFFSKICTDNFCIPDIKLFSNSSLTIKEIELTNFVEKAESCILKNCELVLKIFNVIYYSHDDNDCVKLLVKILDFSPRKHFEFYSDIVEQSAIKKNYFGFKPENVLLGTKRFCINDVVLSDKLNIYALLSCYYITGMLLFLRFPTFHNFIMLYALFGGYIETCGLVAIILNRKLQYLEITEFIQTSLYLLYSEDFCKIRDYINRSIVSLFRYNPTDEVYYFICQFYYYELVYGLIDSQTYQNCCSCLNHAVRTSVSPSRRDTTQDHVGLEILKRHIKPFVSSTADEDIIKLMIKNIEKLKNFDIKKINRNLLATGAFDIYKKTSNCKDLVTIPEPNNISKSDFLYKSDKLVLKNSLNTSLLFKNKRFLLKNFPKVGFLSKNNELLP